MLSTKREADVFGEALAESNVLLAGDMPLVAEEDDLAVHQQIPDPFHLGVGWRCQVDTLNNGTDARRDRLDRQAGASAMGRCG